MKPAINFGDTYEWQEKTIGELGKFYGGLSGKTKEDFNQGNDQFITYMNVFQNIIAKEDDVCQVYVGEEEKQNKVIKDDLLFTQSSETPEEVGMVSVWPHSKKVYLNSFCFGFRLSDGGNNNAVFLSYLLRSPSYRKKISKEAQGISRYNIASSRLAGLSIHLPNIREQEKIASFFTLLDDKITLAERKLGEIESMKDGLLSRIFQKELRFKKDNGDSYPDWKENSFEDTLQFLRAKPVSRADLNFYSGESRNIHYGDILTKYSCVLDVENVVIPFVNDNVDMGETTLLHDRDVIFADTAEDNTAGRAVELMNVRSLKVYSGLHTIPCRPKIQFASGYLGVYLNSKAYHDQLLKLLVGTKVFSISKSNIVKTKIHIPCLEEQEKIASFFLAIDDKIRIQKDRISLLKDQRQALLQQMFV